MHRRKFLVGIGAAGALLLGQTKKVAAAVGHAILGDITQQQDSPNAVGTTFLREDGAPFLRLSAGHDTAPGGNVSLDLTNLLPLGPDGAGRAGIDIAPTGIPSIQAASEIVLYSTPKSGTDFRRMNFSAMADGTVRFGQESAGAYGHKRVVFANETREGQVAAGTEDVFGYDATQRSGSSTPINIMNGHIRFDIPSRGGDLSDYWLARGGAGVEFNTPPGGWVQLLNNGLPVVNVGGNEGGKLLGFYGEPAVYRPVVTSSTDLVQLLNALDALGLIDYRP